VENYYKAQGLWGIPTEKDALEFSQVVELDISTVKPGVAGPKRPQDRIDVDALKTKWAEILAAPAPDGYGKSESKTATVTVDSKGGISDTITHGSVLIAAITSCTNTSNPSVMLAAGLLAKKANALGLTVKPSVKTSLGPGSRVVTDYLNKTGLQDELDKLGFQTVGYGCTTCIGNSGPLDKGIEDVVKSEDIVAASVLSGNRNFEARVHQSIKANFLMSPPLVVAYAIAGTVDIDLTKDALGTSADGKPVYLADIWPTSAEVEAAMNASLKPDVFQRLYTGFSDQNPKWNSIKSSTGNVYEWDRQSTYIQEPPFFDGFTPTPRDIEEIIDAKPLGIFGDSVTTDHISPAGAIKKDSPGGRYLVENGVDFADFNSYGSRRGNDRIMTRGTFANVRIKNLMVPGVEGGVTKLGEETVAIYDAAVAHAKNGTPLVVLGGEDYGMGSSRDWAAKGTNLLGVKAVITKSFERIHRSNLVGMGVLPCNFVNKEDYDKVKDLADATFSLVGISNDIKPQSQATLVVKKADGSSFEIPVVVRLDTPVEIDYYRAGGILPYVLGQIIA
jgi:aconitate hydratase